MDGLLLAQTIILFLTAIIVLWYTIETQRIRKETKRQNLLMYEQIELLKKSQHIEEKKTESILEPIFNWGARTGSIHGKRIQFSFTNEGRMLKIYKIVSNNNFSIRFMPKGFISKGQSGSIVLSVGQEEFGRYIEFEVHFLNEINEKRKKKFKFDSSSGGFETEKSEPIGV